MKIMIALLLISPASWALDLDGYIAKIKDRHRGFKSYDISSEAAKDRLEAGDISLVPVLQLKALWLEDKKQPNFLGASSTVSNQYNLGLSKKFATGTDVSLLALALGSQNKDLGNPALTAYEKYAQGSLGISITQSLWKDFFGHSTTLRHEREAIMAESEKSNYSLQQKQVLIEAESAYWDYIYLHEELNQRKSSAERAQKIESWVKRRASDGIADRADSLNAQALVATRQFQLLNTQDELVANEKKMRTLLEIPDEEKLAEISGRIDFKRDLRQKFKGHQRIVRLDAYLTSLEAKSTATLSRQVDDSYKADLSLAGSYYTNSYESGGAAPDATKSWARATYPTSTVSLTWTYMFDTSVKSAAQNSAHKDALAAQLRSERKLLESDLAWQELLRRNDELDKKINALRSISALQKDRAKAEQDKFSKGRSITTNVINSEQDAAEAELNLIKLLAEQRKLEAQSQLFVSVEDK